MLTCAFYKFLWVCTFHSEFCQRDLISVAAAQYMMLEVCRVTRRPVMATHSTSLLSLSWLSIRCVLQWMVTLTPSLHRMSSLNTVLFIIGSSWQRIFIFPLWHIRLIFCYIQEDQKANKLNESEYVKVGNVRLEFIHSMLEWFHSGSEWIHSRLEWIHSMFRELLE